MYFFFKGGGPETFDSEKGWVFENMTRKRDGLLTFFKDPSTTFARGGGPPI